MRDWRRIRRVFAGTCAIAGPLLFFVATLEEPMGSDDTGAELLAYLQGHSRIEVAADLISIAAILVLAPAFIGAMHVLRNRAPLLGYLGGGLALMGTAFLTVLITVDGVAIEMVARGTSRTDMAAVLDRALTQDLLISVMFGVFVAGHVVGTTLLGVGLWRSRLVPSWSALAVAVAGPGHFVAHVMENKPLDVVAFALFAAGLVTLGVRILRMRDGEWDAAPVYGPSITPAPLTPEAVS